MKESYVEGVALHGGPVHALAFREGAAIGAWLLQA
jgi:hypothetical protein